MLHFLWLLGPFSTHPGQILGRSRADPGQIPGRSRADPGQILAILRCDVALPGVRFAWVFSSGCQGVLKGGVKNPARILEGSLRIVKDR